MRKKIERNIAYDDERKTYYVTLNFGQDQTGKNIKRTKTAQSKREAREILQCHEADKTRGKIVASKDETLAQYFEYFFTHLCHDRAETTLYGYRQIFDNHINPALGKILIQKLTPSHLQKYYTAMRVDKGIKSNTVRKHHDLLSLVMRHAVTEGKLHSSPVSKTKPPQVEKKEINHYSNQQIAALLSSLEGHRLEVPVMLAIYHGLRREEVCGLKWDCINFERQEISIRTVLTMTGSKVIEKNPKTNKSKRVLYFGTAICDMLTREKARQEQNKALLGDAYQESGYVFCWPDGKPYRPNYLSEMFTKHIKESGLPPLTLHGLRHSFVSIGGAEGVALADLSAAAGHSVVSTTTNIYLHPSQKNNHRSVSQTVAQSIDREIERLKKEGNETGSSVE